MVHRKMFRVFAGIIRDQSGVAAVEFGVVGSVLILLMVMATDLGLAMQHRSQMEGAVRAGLQKALDNSVALADVEDYTLNSSDLPTDPAATASAVNQCQCPDGTEIDCTSGTCGAEPPQKYVELTLEQEHRWLLGFPGLPNPTNLSVSRSLRVE